MVGVLDCNVHDVVDEVVTELQRCMMNRGDTRKFVVSRQPWLAELQILRGEIGGIKSNTELIMQTMNVAPVDESS